MKKNRILSLLLSTLILASSLAPFSSLAAPAPEITSDYALLMDAHYDEVLYDKGAYEKTDPASITKVMTALLVMEAIEAGTLSPEDMITADETSRRGMTSDSSTQNIKPGEIMSVKDLLYCMMVPSANEAANILAVAVDGSVDAFLQRMNSRALELGCQNTHFTNAHGMPEENHTPWRPWYRGRCHRQWSSGFPPGDRVHLRLRDTGYQPLRPPHLLQHQRSDHPVALPRLPV